jgi:methylenetetrahydrofolate reductase (NADPH)
VRSLWDRIPGIHILDMLIHRLGQSGDPAQTGKAIRIELIQQLPETPGVPGVHLMAYRREHLVGEIIEASGLRRHSRTKTLEPT